MSSPAVPPADAAARLAAAHDEALRRIAGLTGRFDELVAASVDSNADDEHDPEGTTIAFERSQLDALLRRARQHLDDVGAAQERLAGGSYGLCESCGRPIPQARLEAQPTARTCIPCARRR